MEPGPSLILLNQIKVRVGSAHTLCRLARCVSSGTAPVEPAIRKRLHMVQNLSLVFPKPARIFSKRGRHFGTRQKHLLHVAPLFSEIRTHSGVGAFERIMADQEQILAATTNALGSPPLTPSASEKEPEQLARPARSKNTAM
jgi:hypothetical protein